MRFLHFAVVALFIPSFAFAQIDTVVLRITSPRGSEVRFSGTLTLKDARTERRIENVQTPFELKLPAQNIDARFAATDGGGLSGELVTYRGGKPRGEVTGTMYSGDVRLYFEPGGEFGFGSRFARMFSP